MDLILLIAAILISALVFTWLFKIVKATITTALTIAVIVLALQIVFGIGPTQVWQQVSQIPQIIWKFVSENQ
jgi:type IV secretory pathway TrbL component